MQVIKRDGTIVDFDILKIKTAIEKSFISCQKGYDNDILDLLSLRVSADMQEKIEDGKVHVEDIQDSVEKILSITGYADVAKAYILYRKKRENVRDIESSAMDYQKIVDMYLNGQPVQDNLLSMVSVGGLMLSNSASITRNYWMTSVYDDEVRQAHQQGDIYIHALDMLTAYSAGWSLRQLLSTGLSGSRRKIASKPAKHLYSACSQLVNFLGIMQNEWAAAQCIPSFDTYLAPFVKSDSMTMEEVQKCMETLIYGVNMPSRWGSQAPFSTITMDWNVPDDLKDQNAIVGGVEQDFTYGDCQMEMEMIQQAFLQTLLDADISGRSFPFPIPAITIDETFDWKNKERNRLLFEVTSQYGAPYFINSLKGPKRNPRQSLTDYNTMPLKPGGYFGYGENSGSIGMVTLNLPRLAYVARDKEEFYQLLDQKMDLMARALNTKRQVLSRFLEAGLYPYTKQYMESFDSCFSTFGIIGMNETCLNAQWIKEPLDSQKSIDFCVEVLSKMKEKCLEYQKKYHCFFNVEATPGESVSYKLVRSDRQMYPEMNEEDKMYYTNSTSLPVQFTDDVFEALSIQEQLQSQYTGGSTFHVFLPEGLVHWRDCMNLVHHIAKNYKIANFTISPSYSICLEHGYINGVEEKCPVCQADTEIWARIAGYYQPIEQWNQAKIKEFKERKNFIVK